MATITVMAEPSPASDETSLRDYGDGIPSEPAADRQSWSATWRKAGALLLGGLALAGAIVLAFWLLSPSPKGPQSPATPKGASAAPTPPSASAAVPSTIASTPDQDDKYVQDLNDHGISFANPAAAISNGKMVCDDIRRGVTVPQIVGAFHASNPGLDADTYVSISVHAYCPQNGDLVSGGP